MELFNKALPPVAGKPRGGQWSGMMKTDGSNGRRYGGDVMGEVTLGWWFWGLISISPVQSVGTCFICMPFWHHQDSTVSVQSCFDLNAIRPLLDTMVTVSGSSNICFGSDSPEKARIYLLPQIGCSLPGDLFLHLSYKQKSQEKGGRWLIPLSPFTPGEQVHIVSACWLVFFQKLFKMMKYHTSQSDSSRVLAVDSPQISDPSGCPMGNLPRWPSCLNA